MRQLASSKSSRFKYSKTAFLAQFISDAVTSAKSEVCSQLKQSPARQALSFCQSTCRHARLPAARTGLAMGRLCASMAS